MILVIDNYDSFTYNLVQYVGALGEEIIVRRNDQTTIADIERLKPQRIIISPGPGYPDEAGISCEVIEHFKDKCPILGVCLGHQAVGQVFGGRVMQAGELVHGKSARIHHDNSPTFHGVPNPFDAGRYHSLVVDPDSVPDCLTVTARTGDEMIMGLRHKSYPVEGVQFHPESVLTKYGMKIIENFLRRTS